MELWIEKYRPKSLDEMVGQKSTINTLKHYIETQNVPNLIFYGKRGSGKTSTIHSLCKDLYGDDYKKYVLELNASHERGINTVRTKVKTMAQSKTLKTKMIILDEADSMTKEAMFSLRMIMENYSHITRFCLICNYINKIIEPLKSRCTIFYFQPLSNEDIGQRLNIINGKDNQDIVKYTHGDMRRALLLLQYHVESTDIQDLCGISDELCDRLLDSLQYKSFKESLNICFEIEKGAYDICQMLQLLGKKIYKLDIKNKGKILFLIGETDVNIQQGLWDYMEMIDLCSKIDFLIK